MRTHQWMTAFLSGAVLFLGSWKAEAQYPNGSGYAAYTPVSAQVPEGFNPYPTISPFENTFNETYHQDGHWLFNSNNNTQYRYYASLEALIAIGANPHDALIGSSGRVITPFFDGGDDSIDNGAIGRSFGPSTNADLFDGAGPYPADNAGFISAPIMSGVQLRLGVDTPTGQTFEFTGFGIFPGKSELHNGIPIYRIGPLNDARQIDPTLPSIFDTGTADQVIYAPADYISGNPQDSATGVSPGPFNNIQTDIIDLDNVGAFNPGIPIDDGSILGTVIRNDLYQRKTYQTDVYGLQASVLQMPSRDVGPFTVRPIVGARYINTKSAFNLEGHDSGLDYDVETDPADDTIRFYGGLDGISGLVRFPTRMYLSSDVDTNLGGAEMGWRYTTGGNSFKFEGETRFGLMGAQEKITVKSRGFGQPFFFNQGSPVANINIFYDETLETVHSQEHAYVTPTFQQSFNTTSRPFEYIPVLRSIPMFREANFKAGWTILAVLQMSRPEKSIRYQTGNGAVPDEIEPITGLPWEVLLGTPHGDPSLIPEGKVDRSLWFVQYFNLGLEWIY